MRHTTFVSCDFLENRFYGHSIYVLQIVDVFLRLSTYLRDLLIYVHVCDSCVCPFCEPSWSK